MHTGFWWETLRERKLLEDQGIDGKIIFSWRFRMWDVGCGSVVWINLAQDSDG